MNFTPTQEQLTILQEFNNHRVMKINAVAGSGKEQPVSTSTPTPYGIVPFGSLKVGDKVFGSNGKPTIITAVFPQGVKDVYEVTFRDGSKVRCGLEHNWAVTSIGMRNQRKTVTLTTAELLEKGVINKHGNMQFKVPLTSAVEFEAKDLTLHPYILGVFLGNGSLRVVEGQYKTSLLSLHKDDIEVYEKVKSIFEDTAQLVLKGIPRFTSENGIQVNLTTASDNTTNPVTQLFKNLCVSSANKHVPDIYLQGSIDQRLHLLQGLMDTDGCITKGRVSFSNTNKNLIEAVKYLVQSLGGTAILRKPDMRKPVICYDLNIKMPVNPFSLTRKASQWKLSWKNPPSRYITQIENLGFQEEQMCITVDAEDSLYLTSGFVVTHNTSTMKMLAQEHTQPSLYVCFNKQNAVEASKSFPNHTDCRTVHSLAYSVFGKNLSHKLMFKDTSYVNRGRTPKEIVNLYSIADYSNKKVFIPSIRLGFLVKKTVDVYQNTANINITEDCIPAELYQKLNIKDKVDIQKINEIVLMYANKLWLDRIDIGSKVKAEHDTYQKLYQLSNPVLDYDVIYLDEAQDSSPVVLDILSKQTHAKIVYVGDTFQSIYAFRQAVNAMETIQGVPTYLLSKSFRYGAEIATIAKTVIRDGVDVQGSENIKSRIGDIESKKYTHIFRTNSYLLETAVDLISQGVAVKCLIDPRKFQSMIYSTFYLKKGEMSKVKDEEVLVYASFDEMIEDSNNNPESKRLVDIVLKGKMFEYNKALDKMIKDKDKKNYDVFLTTAHKSKGMEWLDVKIADDFKIDVITSNNAETFDQQEVNLFYVACTRAINNLQLPSEYVAHLIQKEKHVGIG